MKITSDKRREVAARLRENAGEHGVTLDYLNSTQVASWWLLLHTIGCDSNEQESVFRMLADLIDPTCQEVPMESVGRWPFYTGIDLHLEMVSYGCSVCGYPWGEIDKWATHGAGWHNSPKYCPNCGRRVVKGMMK